MAKRTYSTKSCSACNELFMGANRKNASSICASCKRAAKAKRDKDWAKANRKRRRLSEYAWRRKNPEKVRAMQKQASQAIAPEKKREYQQRYLLRNAEKRKESQREYRRSKSERVAASNRKWRQRNPDACRTHVHNRRARIAKAEGSHTASDIAAIRKLQHDHCAICGKPLHGRGTVDHITPLAKGGSNDRRNLQLAHKLCNSRKGAKDPIQFMQEQGFLL